MMDDPNQQPERARVKDPPTRWRRARDLVLLLTLAFGWAFLNSTLFFIQTGRQSHVISSLGVTLAYVVAIVFYLGVLALLIWVLRRQGRTIRDIGWAVSWKDVPVSIAVLVIGYVALWFALLAMFYGYYFATGRVLDYRARNIEALHLSVSVVVILFLIANAFYEELLARAYLMTEVRSLIGSRVLAVIVSAVFQAAYHLYQGLPSAFLIFVLFLVFSLYFVRWKRILPLILAHLVLDLVSVIIYARG